jgi:ferritin-like metal-binding protein YciE
MRKITMQEPINNFISTIVLKDQAPKDMLRNYFIAEIQSLYWTEKYLLKALPKIEAGVRTVELKEALEDHSSVTDDHVERLEQIFEMLKEVKQVRKCETMDGLIKETGQLIHRIGEIDLVRDAGAIIMLKKMQHYQVAVYESLVHLAKILGEPFVAGILQRSLTDDKKALEIFSRLAECHINENALLESENELDDVE